MNTKFRTVYALLLTLASVCTLTAQSSTEENLRRADTQFDLYAYNTALNTYNEVLRVEPNNAYAIGRKADCYFQLNRPGEALPFYDRAVTLGRSEAEIVFRYAQALMQTGDYVGAKRWFTQYAASNPATGQHYAAMCDYASTASQRAGMYTVKNELLNTSSADFAPSFYGNRIVYSSARRDIARKSPKGDSGAGANEVFVTQKNPEDGFLQRPSHLIADLQKSTYFNEGPVSYAAGGTKVAFCHNKFVDGTRQIASKGMEMSIYIADVEPGGKWASPKPFQYNSSDYAVGFPWLSNDGTSLYFASNMPGGMGGWDLYSSTFSTVTGLWSVPRNLGATVNTPGDEVSPFIEGTDIYFASDWHNGLGGLDIFRADFDNNYATNVVNLGMGVNSSRDDYGFIFDSKSNSGYFTSNRSEGKGNEDIWQIGRGRDEFSVTVRDQYQQPIPEAEIDFSSCGAGVMRTDMAGRYEFATAKGQTNCVVIIKKAGYSPATIRISSDGEHNMTVALAAIGSADAGTAPATYSTTTPTTMTTTTGTVMTESLGSVIDQDNRDPLYTVKVSALPWPNGTPIETYSNYSGQYTLNLEPARAYTLTFSKAGYGDMSTNIFSGAAGTQTTVNQVGMTKTVAPAPIAVAPVVTPITTDQAKQRTGAIPTYTAPTTYNTTTQPVLITPIATTSSNPTMNGYAIQLAATPNGAKEPDMSKLEPFTEYGNLYTSSENNLNKIRLGVFSTKADADAVLKKVKNTKKDAFIVEEKNVDASMAANYTDTESSLAVVDNKKSPNLDTKVVAPVLPQVVPTQFAIQVKSVDQTEAILLNQYAELGQFGNLYTRSENGATRIRVGVWNSQADAETALNMIMAKGYKEAVVIVEKAGSEIPVATTLYPAIVPPTNTTPSLAPPSGSVMPSLTPTYSAPTTTPQGALPDLLSPTSYSTTSAKGATMVPLTAPTLSGEQYMVRICTLTGDPTKFDVKKAEKAGGRVDGRQEPSGAIIMLLRDFPDQNAAIVAKNKLIALGFPDAFVVKEINNDGVLKRMGL